MSRWWPGQSEHEGFPADLGKLAALSGARLLMPRSWYAAEWRAERSSRAAALRAACTSRLWLPPALAERWALGVVCLVFVLAHALRLPAESPWWWPMAWLLPAWALGILFVVVDLQGAASQQGNVAHVAHLAGAAFGLLYVFGRVLRFL